jgi:hypothetical protein
MSLGLPALDNLVRAGQLKAEPCNEAEASRMLAMARTRVADARVASLSPEGRFTSAYNAAHAAALAALRWHGYRSEIRYTVVPLAYRQLAGGPLASAGYGPSEKKPRGVRGCSGGGRIRHCGAMCRGYGADRRRGKAA